MITAEQDRALCNHCGKPFLVHGAQPAQGPNEEKYFEIAKASLKAGNIEEAYYYYNKTLELNPSHAWAWIGKGIAALYICIVERQPDNIQGALEYIRTGLSNSPIEEQPILVEETGAHLAIICGEFAKALLDDLRKFQEEIERPMLETNDTEWYNGNQDTINNYWHEFTVNASKVIIYFQTGNGLCENKSLIKSSISPMIELCNTFTNGIPQCYELSIIDHNTQTFKVVARTMTAPELLRIADIEKTSEILRLLRSNEQ